VLPFTEAYLSEENEGVNKWAGYLTHCIMCHKACLSLHEISDLVFCFRSDGNHSYQYYNLPFMSSTYPSFISGNHTDMNMNTRPFNTTNRSNIHASYGSERPLNARNSTPTPIMRERQPAAPSPAASTSSSVSPVSTSKDNDDTGKGWTPLAVKALIHTYDSK
jgi:hypothetical protein